MSAPPRPAARPAWLTRRTIARSSVLGLGLLVAAGTTPAAAVAAQDGEGTSPGADSREAEARTAGAPLNIAPAGNSDKDKNAQGNAGQGDNGQSNPGQGNENPGGGTPGNNTPGTNEAGHPNGGTGDTPDAGEGDPTDEGEGDPTDEAGDGDGDVVTPPLVAGFGTGKQFDLAVSTTGPVPEDLQLSGAQFTFTAVDVSPFPIVDGSGVTAPLPAPVTCTTDAAGTCTVTGGFGVPEVIDGSNVLLPFGSYTVTQTVAIPGLGSVSWANETMTLCFIGCEFSKPISAISPSLFRQQIAATVVDDAGAVVADAGYSLEGPDFRRSVDPADASPTLPAVANSDGVGVLVFDGWFVPGEWTFTPTATAPNGSAFLAETQELVTTAAEADAATPWDVELLLSTGQPTDEGDGTGDGDTGTGDGDTGTGDGDTGTGDGETGTGDGDTGTGDGETDGGDTGGAEGPDSEGPDAGPGRPVPDAGNPGTGNPGTPPGGAAAPAAPSEAGDVGTAGTPGDAQPAGQAAPTTSPAPTTPSSRPTTSTPSRSSTSPSLPPEFVLTESTPELQTVSFGFREAGFAAFGVVFLGAVFFGLLLFRRRSRRQR